MPEDSRQLPRLNDSHACNNPTCHCQAILRARAMNGPPHVWTIPEIMALPEFGNEHGWFYGFVECDGGEGVEIAEIIPGTGWTSVDPPDIAESWHEILNDVRSHRPGVRADA